MMTKSEKRAITLRAETKRLGGMSKAAKSMGIPYPAARRILERLDGKEYKFQREAPWHGWAAR